MQSLLQRHLDAYRATRKLSATQWKAVNALTRCRTAALGGHVRRCEHGHIDGVWYNSCRHRYCPQCNGLATERWLERQRARLLDCPHRHLVFTLPGELRLLFRLNEAELTEALFAAVRETVLTLFADERWVGAKPGIVLVRHTWGRNLSYHPHIHCLVSEGGMDRTGNWRTPRRAVLVPVRVLMSLYRGKLLAKVRALAEQGLLTLPTDQRPSQLRALLNALGRRPWNVHLGERYAHGQGVVTYLGRYVRGGPLRRKSLRSTRSGTVVMDYTRHGNGEPRRARLRLEGAELVARYLSHVPAQRKRLVRCAGLYAGGAGKALDLAREALGQRPVEPPQPKAWQHYLRARAPSALRCRQCGAEVAAYAQFGPSRGPPSPPPARQTEPPCR